MPVEADERKTLDLFERVEMIEEVAASMDRDDPRREQLRCVVSMEFKFADPVRVITAARLLSLNEKTVRTWVREGVLAAQTNKPRLLLDAEQLHEIRHLVDDLRAAGTTSGLLDEMFYRLSDAATLASPELHKSLAQMRRGEGRAVPERSK